MNEGYNEQHHIWIDLPEYLFYKSILNHGKIKSTSSQDFSNSLETFRPFRLYDFEMISTKNARS